MHIGYEFLPIKRKLLSISFSCPQKIVAADTIVSTVLQPLSVVRKRGGEREGARQRQRKMERKRERKGEGGRKRERDWGRGSEREGEGEGEKGREREREGERERKKMREESS